MGVAPGPTRGRPGCFARVARAIAQLDAVLTEWRQGNGDQARDGRGHCRRPAGSAAPRVTGTSSKASTFSDAETSPSPSASVRFSERLRQRQDPCGRGGLRSGARSDYSRRRSRARPSGCDDGVLALETRARKRDCWIDYDVTVRPRARQVSGQLDSGSGERRRGGEVNVRAGSGNVTVRDVAGEVNVDGAVRRHRPMSAARSWRRSTRATSSRRSRGRRHAGGLVRRGRGARSAARAQVESASGNVVVELTKAADVRVNAESGAVEVTVPQGDYKVATSTDSGNVDSDVATTRPARTGSTCAPTAETSRSRRPDAGTFRDCHYVGHAGRLSAGAQVRFDG